MTGINYLSLKQLVEIAGNEQGVLTKERLMQADLRKLIPIVPDPGLIKDFYVLLNYTAPNPQQIKTMVITPAGVYLTPRSTKQILQYHMRHSILDVSVVRALRTHLAQADNCELSLCFANWVAMHLSGVSSSKLADWVALHHTKAIVAGQDANTRVFQLASNLQVALPVQRNFDTRLTHLEWMSAIELEAFRHLCAEVGVPMDLAKLSRNILRDADVNFRSHCEAVSAEGIGRYLLSFQELTLEAVRRHPELGILTVIFIDFKHYFLVQLERSRSFN
ncbi:hypothetical protein [Lapidilactobacillus salsurivasis]